MHLVQADAREDLAAVQRRRAHAHQDFARLRLRLGHFARHEYRLAVYGFYVVALHIFDKRDE
ncbi:hypothetical protein D3C83_149610 [compost metagenome]